MLRLYSPAKLNLFLCILSRRPDGYHQLASLMQTVTPLDTVNIELSERDFLTCNHSKLPTDGSNLAYKALSLFKARSGLEFNVHIHLDKKIPFEAGLGGGSSNAATVLWGLNQLFNFPVAEQTLSTWAAELGSDVAFFLSQGTAYCTGRGECVHSLPFLEQRNNFWIVKPALGCSTAAVYAKLQKAQFSSQNPELCLQNSLASHPVYFNELEEAAFLVYPELKKIKAQLLSAGFNPVVLAGSGSSFFCGGEEAPSIPDCEVYPAYFVQREPNKWYTAPISSSVTNFSEVFN